MKKNFARFVSMLQNKCREGHCPENRNGMAVRFSAMLGVVFLALGCAALCFIALLSIFTTGYFEFEHKSSLSAIVSERMVLNHGFPSLGFILGVVLVLLALLGMASGWLKFFPTTKLGEFIVVYTFGVSSLWIMALNATGNKYGYNDSTSLIEAAGALVQGRISEFAPTVVGRPPAYDYFSWYPFQTGALLWFAAVFAVFGVGNIIALQMANVVCLSAIAWMLYRVGVGMGLTAKGQRLEILMIMTSVPFLTSPAFVYSNTTGLLLILASLLAAIKTVKQERILPFVVWTVVCFVIGAIAVMVKGTVIVLLIAFAMVLVIVAIRRRKYWAILLDVVLLYLANKASLLPLTLVEHMVQQRFGGGLPQLSWIAIGLTPSDFPGHMPGWWDGRAIHAYRISGGSMDAQMSAARSDIHTAIAGFLQHPPEAVRFFLRKLGSEWSEPTYQTLYYSSLAERRDNGFIVSRTFFGTGNAVLIGFENLHQTIMYVFAALGFGLPIRNIWKSRNVANNMKDHGIYVILFMALVFLGGFGCFLLWEAKSVYILPFAIMLIPVAAYGLQHTTDSLFCEKLANRLFKDV